MPQAVFSGKGKSLGSNNGKLLYFTRKRSRQYDEDYDGYCAHDYDYGTSDECAILAASLYGKYFRETIKLRSVRAPCRLYDLDSVPLAFDERRRALLRWLRELLGCFRTGHSREVALRRFGSEAPHAHLLTLLKCLIALIPFEIVLFN